MLYFVDSPKTFLFWEEISQTMFSQEVCFNMDLPDPFFFCSKKMSDLFTISQEAFIKG